MGDRNGQLATDGSRMRGLPQALAALVAQMSIPVPKIG